MAIIDLFSKREARKKKQGTEDVFQYDDLPREFRVQVIHIWGDALSGWHCDYPSHLRCPPNTWWREIFEMITRERGVFHLTEKRANPFEQCREYLLQADTSDALDLIELTFRVIHVCARGLHEFDRKQWKLRSPDDAIQELNGRFREHGIGYEFVNGELVRVDSKYIHAKAVRPALELLHGAGKGFSGPLQEFLHAHEYHRKGEDKDAMAWVLKAFESTMKAICTARKWTFDPQKDTAKNLIDIVFANNLIPAYLKTQLSSLRAVLEGLPTVRNKNAGHGQGPTPTVVPGHFTSYAMHMAASNIVFLMECHKAMK